MARKKPAKTNARKPNHDDRAPFGFYIPSEVTTSSRTQAPAKPVKATRVKRPRSWRNRTMEIDRTSEGMWFIAVSSRIAWLYASEAKSAAAWLTHAAAYLEQEARRKA